MKVGPFHAFVDESIRPDGYYRLTAVRVHARDIGAIGRAIRAQVPRGQRRVHFATEGAGRKRSILGSFSGLPIAATVYRTPYERRANDQVARDRCLRALIEDVAAARVTLVVFDSRGPVRDAVDRRVLAQAVRSAQAPHVVYTHRGSRDELLLGLPDAIGWAAGAKGVWRQLIAEVAVVRNVDETG